MEQGKRESTLTELFRIADALHTSHAILFVDVIAAWRSDPAHRISSGSFASAITTSWGLPRAFQRVLVCCRSDPRRSETQRTAPYARGGIARYGHDLCAPRFPFVDAEGSESIGQGDVMNLYEAKLRESAVCLWGGALRLP